MNTKSKFPILAIETTGELCSAAVLIDEKNFVELNHLQKHIHSQKLIEMIDIVLKQCSLTISELKAIAVSMGPGSFTGLRIGLSAAKGLAFGSSIPIIPVPTFAAHALQISDQVNTNTKFNLITSASIDDVYFAKFQLKENSVETLHELELLDRENVQSFISEEEINYGNISITGYEVKNNNLRASYLGKWAYLFGFDLLTFDYDNLEPNYIKQFVGKVKK